MGDLRFDSDQQEEFGRPAGSASGGDLTSKFIAWGIVSNRQQAEYVMIGLAILIVIVAFFVYRSA
ncbi:MAG: hypothetical protein Q7R90_04030 [bacterium]|nr:hypothetical protein [bacterium]